MLGDHVHALTAQALDLAGDWARPTSSLKLAVFGWARRAWAGWSGQDGPVGLASRYEKKAIWKRLKAPHIRTVLFDLRCTCQSVARQAKVLRESRPLTLSNASPRRGRRCFHLGHGLDSHLDHFSCHGLGAHGFGLVGVVSGSSATIVARSMLTCDRRRG